MFEIIIILKKFKEIKKGKVHTGCLTVFVFIALTFDLIYIFQSIYVYTQ